MDNTGDRSIRKDRERAPSEYPHARDQVMAIIEEFKKESDRACVIIAAARADSLLSQILSKFLLPNTASQDDLLDSDRALGTFSARIHATYRLGLIDAEVARALHLLRKLRNQFAHETASASMEQSSHRDRVREIISPLVQFQNFRSLRELMGNKASAAADFCAGVSVIMARLESLLEIIKPVNQTQTCHLVPPKWLSKNEKQGTVNK